MSNPDHRIEFRVRGRYAMFTDPLTRIGGERCSYQVPTYEALKGIAKSIYWKPTFTWIIDSVRVMKAIRTQTRAMKPLQFDGVYPSERSSKKQEPFNTLAIYTYLTGGDGLEAGNNSEALGVEYQVRAHFEWNAYQSALEADRNSGKHCAILNRSLQHGGRQDIFLGTRDCQAYVEPCEFGQGSGAYDNVSEIAFGLMFHSFDYPDETGKSELWSNFWMPVLMKYGEIQFPRPDQCRKDLKRLVRPMTAKRFGIGENVRSVESEAAELGA